jgi:YD repeat-containing protein
MVRTAARLRAAPEWERPMSALTIAFLMATTVLAAAQNQTTFRDANGRITGTVTTDSNGMKTFRDGSGRITGTATRDSNGTTAFRDASGRTTGTASTPRR